MDDSPLVKDDQFLQHAIQINAQTVKDDSVSVKVPIDDIKTADSHTAFNFDRPPLIIVVRKKDILKKSEIFNAAKFEAKTVKSTIDFIHYWSTKLGRAT